MQMHHAVIVVKRLCLSLSPPFTHSGSSVTVKQSKNMFMVNAYGCKICVTQEEGQQEEGERDTKLVRKKGTRFIFQVYLT